MTLRIEPFPADDQDLVGTIQAGLKASNSAKMEAQGLDLSLLERHEILLAAREGDALRGGLIGFVKYTWLYVDTLWVAEASRGQGVGAALLAEAERRAIALGARRSWLLSLTLEAPDYYLRHGYRPFAALEDYPPGQSLRFLQKALLD